MGLASNARIRVLSCRSPDPGIDHIDKTKLRAPSMAYSIALLGFNGVHDIYEHHRREVPTQV